MTKCALFLSLALVACSTGAGRTTPDGAVDDEGPTTKPQDLAGDDLTGVDLTTAPADLSMTTTTGSSDVTIIVEPSDKGAALLAAITAAKTSIHMTMYLLSSDSITSALIARKKAGVDVKVVLNETFPTTSTSNQSYYTQLMNGGVPVVWAPSTFMYTHEKSLVIDGTTAWIMTMNATGTSPVDNREYLAIDTNAGDVAEVEAIFEADYANKTWAMSGDLLVSPVNSRDRLVAFIGTATASVDLEVEELSDTKVVAALTAQQDAKHPVRVVLSDEAPATAQTSAIATLKTHNVSVVVTSSPYIHGKAIVVDGKSAFIGSENFTTGSLEYNREVGLTFSIASEVQKVAAAIATDYSNGTAQ